MKEKFKLNRPQEMSDFGKELFQKMSNVNFLVSSGVSPLEASSTVFGKKIADDTQAILERCKQEKK